jgi:hypothetical protein
MTVDPGEKPGLQAIAGPSTAPSEIPDPLTKGEIKKAKTAANRVSPSDRHAAAVERHLDDACGERDHLRQENRRLQSEIDRLGPKYAGLKEAFSFALVGSAASTIFLAIGSALVSAASVWLEHKVPILCGGCAVLACGIATFAASTIYALKRE